MCEKVQQMSSSDQLPLFADAGVTNERLCSAAIKERDHNTHDTMEVKEEGGVDIVHDCINSSGQCVSLEGRLKVMEGRGEQTVPRNPDLPSLLQAAVDRDS